MFLYMTPIAPLPSAAILVVVCILMLKMHSYVATNYAIYLVRGVCTLYNIIARHGMAPQAVCCGRLPFYSLLHIGMHTLHV